MPPANTLDDFIDQTETLLQELVDNRDSLMRRHLRDSLHRAWTALRTRDAFNQLRIGLRQTLPNQLTVAGLDGAELDLKLEGFNEAMDAFRLQMQATGWIGRRLRKLLLRLLKWINTILGSLSSVIPSGEAIKELKEVLENGVEEAADDDDDDDESS